MANEHLKTASMNLMRAVSDVKQLQNELRSAAENSKRDLSAQTSRLEAEIKQLEISRHKEDTHSSSKIAIELQIKNLQLQIAKLKKDTEIHINDLEQQAQSLDSQVYEFQSLSSRLQMLA